MQLIGRSIQKSITESLFNGKVIIIYGARQVGKTTLVNQIIKDFDGSSRYLNCELLSVRQNLQVQEAEMLKSYLGNYKLVVLDEAQKIPDIGTILKIMADNLPDIQIIATGSSSFDLANQTNEPLTGRAVRFTLYPFSLEEIGKNLDKFDLDARLENFLRFGMYPDVFFSAELGAVDKLMEIASNYLYKDILAFERIKKSSLLENLLRLLALQLGNEVSYQELATNLGVSRITVQKYIDILEQCFIVFTLHAFSRNKRKEIAKSVKIYFYDLGIRNALIQNYNHMAIRNDVGALWENFMISERIKSTSLRKSHFNRYFWRTYDQKEIDYIEERDGAFFAYEFKWGKGVVKPPQGFLDAYKNAVFQPVNRENYLEFVK